MRAIESIAIESEHPALEGMKTRIALLIVIVAALAAFHLPIAGQSGRGPQQRSKRTPPDSDSPTPPSRFPDSRQTKSKQTGGETIRIDTDLVNIVASVTSQTGVGMSELQRDDFEVLEDGAPQEIVNFSREEETPLRLVMLFDSSTSVARRIDFQRVAAARFFGRVMRPKDEAALFAVSTDIEVIQGLTNKVSRITAATTQLRAEGATSLYDGVFLAAEYLRPYSGRHTIVIVSDGGDTTSQKNLMQALIQAQLANAVIYAVFSGNPYRSENLRDLAAERALITLTEETGGEVYFPQSKFSAREKEPDAQEINHLDNAFAALADRLHTQYTLGYYSSNETRDGQFRKLTVRIKKPGYRAHARSGYYAPQS